MCTVLGTGIQQKPHSEETSYTVLKQKNSDWLTEFEKTGSDSK